jgi:D-xylose transport system permease protein
LCSLIIFFKLEEKMQNSQSKPAIQQQSFLQNLNLDVRILAMLVVLAGVWVIFQALTEGAFLSSVNLWNLSVQTAVVGIMVSGMVMIIVTRQIDLSVGSVLGFTGMIMAIVQAQSLGLGWHWTIALLIGLLAGVAIGAFNGYWVAFWGIPSFVVTLAGMLIFRSGSFIVASGKTIAPLDESFQLIGGGLRGSIGATGTWIFGALAIGWVLFQTLSNRSRRQKHQLLVRPPWAEALVTGVMVLLILGFVYIMNDVKSPGGDTARGIPVPVLITLAVLGWLSWAMQSTRFGRYVYAIGGNPEAALLAGINVKRMTLYIFMLMGFLSALAGAVQAARLNAVTNSMGTNQELSVIAAAVVGGTALAGGSGTIIGAALGALLMSSLQSGMGLLDIATEWQNVVLGSVLLVAVIFNTLYLKNRRA